MFKKKEENPEKSPEKKSVKKPEVPVVKKGIATVLEFTGHPDNTVSVLAETDGGEKVRVEMEGKYEDFKVGQKIELK